VKQLNLSYDPAAGKFQARLGRPEATVCLTESALIDAVAVGLQKLSRELEGFPLAELRFARIKELVRLVKNAVTQNHPSEGEVIDPRHRISDGLLWDPRPNAEGS